MNAEQSRRRWRAHMRARADACRKAARRLGLRHAVHLVDVLADVAITPGELPRPGQRYLARECGVTVRTVRRWTVALEAVGIVDVRRARPMHGPAGTFVQPTHRYVLCDVRSARVAACPVPRKRWSHRADTGVRLPAGVEPAAGGAGGQRSLFVRSAAAEWHPPPPGDPPDVDVGRNLAGIGTTRAALRAAMAGGSAAAGR